MATLPSSSNDNHSHALESCTHPPTSTPSTVTNSGNGLSSSLPHLRLAPYLTNAPSGASNSALSPSLRFPVIERYLPTGVVTKVGRYTERTSRQQQQLREQAQDQGVPPTHVDDVLFKSKVVSRSHAEIWVEDGKFFIRDTASSSGTFLNHTRLSAQNIRSETHRLRDGDCLQLGVEYRGGEEEIYRCVRMRVELNRRSVANTALRMATLTALSEAQAVSRRNSTLRALSPGIPIGSSGPSTPGLTEDVPKAAPACRLSIGPVTTDCCICLLPLRRTPLFLTPCAHAFHFACVRTLLNTRRNRGGRMVYEPVDGFNCPMCRSYVDLTAEPADEDDDDITELAEMTAIGVALGLNVSPDASRKILPLSATSGEDGSGAAGLARTVDLTTTTATAADRLPPLSLMQATTTTAASASAGVTTDEDADSPGDADAISSADDEAEIEAAVAAVARMQLAESNISAAVAATNVASAQFALENADTDSVSPIQMPGGDRSARAHDSMATADDENVGGIPPALSEEDFAQGAVDSNASSVDSASLLGKTMQTRQPIVLLAEAAAAAEEADRSRSLLGSGPGAATTTSSSTDAAGLDTL